jgi:hypothetical protein
MSFSGVKKIEEPEFANPKLRFIGAQIKVYEAQSFSQSIKLELEAWLTIFYSISLLLIPLWYGAFFYFLFLLIPVSFRLHKSLPEFYRLRRLAKRHRIDNFAALRKDPRDPVLYLRPFHADVTSDPERVEGMTNEELLTSLFQDIGPVIAIGDPNESPDPDKSLPIIGASRIYLKEEKWQNTVERLMSISQYVIIDMGTTPGLLWEIGVAAKQVAPSKLFVSLLSWRLFDETIQQIYYEQFKEAAENVLNESLGWNIRLPESIGDAIFLTFDSKWKPKLIRDEWNQTRI